MGSPALELEPKILEAPLDPQYTGKVREGLLGPLA